MLIENNEISPVIIAAVDLMKKVNEGLEVEYIGVMRRDAIGKNENGLLSTIGVSTRMTFFGIEKQVFLGCQMCEDMLNPIGHLVADDYIMGIFKDDFVNKFKDFDFTYNSNENE
jgi:hypothetical protein